jgi:hypothetical protein
MFLKNEMAISSVEARPSAMKFFASSIIFSLPHPCLSQSWKSDFANSYSSEAFFYCAPKSGITMDGSFFRFSA